MLDIAYLLHRVWSSETCYPRVRKFWKKENPSVGQCAVTSLVINDFFGGEILFNAEYNHFWNRLEDGTEIDLTKGQFKCDISLLDNYKVDRKTILFTKNATRARTYERYQILLKKLNSLFVESVE